MKDPRNWDFSLGEDKEEVSARSRWFFCYDRLELDEASAAVTGIWESIMISVDKYLYTLEREK